MRNAKTWLFGTFLVVALAGTADLLVSSSGRAEPQREERKDQWRHHEGHWSYWHEGDKRW